MNCTVPVGVALPPIGVTVAVRVCPARLRLVLVYSNGEGSCTPRTRQSMPSEISSLPLLVNATPIAPSSVAMVAGPLSPSPLGHDVVPPPPPPAPAEV